MALYCKEILNNEGNIVARLCYNSSFGISSQRSDFPLPRYNITEVSSCGQCPPFPLNNEMTLEDIKRIIKDEINDHEHRHHEH